MNVKAKGLLLFALALCLRPLLGQTQRQPVPLSGPATRLSSVEYWPAPNDKQAKLRLEGSQMTPLPDAKWNVKDLTVHSFSETGKLQAVVEAPECVYEPLDGVASSPGHLHLKLMDDKIDTKGSNGFVWRQSENTLSITNVHTVIKTAAGKLSIP
ncbi:MAG: hypothetical protein ABSH48_08320 [Verrucomicrobiota bacterium]